MIRTWEEQAKVISNLRTVIASLRDALITFGEHDYTCRLAHFQAGRHPIDGGYENNYAGIWYRSGEEPPCTCGLQAAQNGDEAEKAMGAKSMSKKQNPHRGSSFDEFLREDGIYEEVTAKAIKRVEHLAQKMKKETEMSKDLVEERAATKEEVADAIATLEAENARLREDMSELQVVCDALKTDASSYYCSYEKLMDERDSLRTKNEELEGRVGQLSEDWMNERGEE